MFDELRTWKEEVRMTPSSTHRGVDRPSRSRALSERRTEALVAAYIHELSPRHQAARESRRARPETVELRT
jgi:hypothetical protein